MFELPKFGGLFLQDPHAQILPTAQIFTLLTIQCGPMLRERPAGKDLQIWGV